MTRQARLFAAEYLRGRRTGMTAQEIAERFGVTVRTVYRGARSRRRGSRAARCASATGAPTGPRANAR